MARKAYIGVQTSHTYTNMLGGIGDMETGTVYKTTAEAAYLKNSSQHKFGSSSQAFQQSGSATELTYTLRNSSGQMSFALDNTHQYYFSVWIRQNTSLDLSFDWYWPIAEPSVMSGVKNAALNTWEHHSAVVDRSGFTSGSYPMRIDCNNYPGNNALMYVDGLMVVDLTAMYGAGNEPTKEFCDQYFAFTTGTNTVTIPTAREIKKMYIGVGGVARKVKKGYIGVGGVARPFFSGGELSYYGTATALNTSTYYLQAATVGNYALFAGGYSSRAVNAYNSSLTQTTATELGNTKYNGAAATVGNYALFAGGHTSSSTRAATVYAYNTSLTQTTATALSAARGELAAATVGNYALFGGGRTATSNMSKVVNAYDGELTMTTATALSTARFNLAGAAAGGYGIFAGGQTRYNNYGSNEVNAYDGELTMTTATALSLARCGIQGTALGGHAIFAGGKTDEYVYSNIVNAYDGELTMSALTNLSEYRYEHAGATAGDYAMFAGGYNTRSSSTGVSNTADVYDTELTLLTSTLELDPMNTARCRLAATTIGSYALFGGGWIPTSSSAGSSSAVVDAYTA
jgi:hypothetical protein